MYQQHQTVNGEVLRLIKQFQLKWQCSMEQAKMALVTEMGNPLTGALEKVDRENEG